jgi:glycine C-acetyltransferase
MILLRLIPTASHTDAEINETLAAFESIYNKLASGYYKEAEAKLLKEQNLEFKPI